MRMAVGWGGARYTQGYPLSQSMNAARHAPLGTEVGLGPGDIVLDWYPAPLYGKGHSTAAPFFSAHVYCSQTVAHLSNC